ncbi:amidohydrolase family protein [Daejeonella lutea]|uniref:L-fuconolactonase n=1 Tax=Daejeonella lutea TaxID=572036 RepID=A0A1T5BA68_9SPHI|nr:amidohydrolase family protein [Daejeonella lutea]SKB43773.1 L-fuconolactonase [Daejeonella lutea]
MLKVDSHQHFWIFDPLRDKWITHDMENIRRDFLPEDLKPILQDNDISGCIAVQADQSEQETKFLLDLAEYNDYVLGVVGWVDLRAGNLRERLEYYKTFSKLKGFRHIVQAEGPGYMVDPVFLRGIRTLTDYGFAYDILVRSEQISEASKLVELNPDQRFVLDHIGKPLIKKGEIRDWEKEIRQFASYDNVSCKLSGLVTEADIEHWKYSEILPYMEIVLNAFGANRVMFGSDWPVCKLAAEYGAICDVISSFLEPLSSSEKQFIWGQTALEFYRLELN